MNSKKMKKIMKNEASQFFFRFPEFLYIAAFFCMRFEVKNKKWKIPSKPKLASISTRPLDCTGNDLSLNFLVNYRYLLAYLIPGTSYEQVAEEATGQGHPATAVQRAIAIMSVRGELQEKNRGFLLYRMR